LEVDPKLSWALRHLDQFPVNLQTADYKMILRIPGIGVKTAQKIVSARQFQVLTIDHLKKLEQRSTVLNILLILHMEIHF
jgi:predicted DNA-binding helix-hairpin-helix protein